MHFNINMPKMPGAAKVRKAPAAKRPPGGREQPYPEDPKKNLGSKGAMQTILGFGMLDK
jgi:hypothetical protein